jgi:hypothetical protein
LKDDLIFLSGETIIRSLRDHVFINCVLPN